MTSGAPVDGRPKLPVTVILTTFNEARTIRPVLESLASSDALPEEVVICDGGSDDDTVPIMEAYAREHPELGLRVIVAPGLNISAGRNAAISAARTELIIGTDAGCTVEPSWLRKMAEPLTADPPADVVGGMFRPVVTNKFQRATLPLHERSVASIAHSPSSRSIAFRRDIWEQLGGYPIGLLTAEDTVFNDQWRAAGVRYVFREDAVVNRRAQPDLSSLLIRARRYGRGDGQAGLFPVRRLAPLVLALVVVTALVLGVVRRPIWSAPAALGLVALLVNHARRGRLRSAGDALVFVPAHFLVGLLGSLAYLRGRGDRLWWAIAGRPAQSPQTTLFDTDHRG